MVWLLVFIITVGDVEIRLNMNTYETEESCHHDAKTILNDDDFNKKMKEKNATVTYGCLEQRVKYEL